MKKVGFGLLAASLALVVGAAVSTLLAQTPVPTPDPAPRPHRPFDELRAVPSEVEGREFRMLDGRGSRLGVTVIDLTATDGRTGGARIDEIDRDGAAAKAGLQQGDVVIEFDGERVRSARQFSRLVQETPDGRPVKVAFLRGDQKQTIDVTPESRSAWHVEIDGDRIRRDVERGLRGLDRLPYLDFKKPDFDFDFDFDFDHDAPIRTPRGRLGMQLDALTPQLAEYFGAKNGGVLVSGVTPDSPAAKAGLKAGDVVVSINGARVRDVGDLRSELRDAPTGELSIGIVRDRKEATLKGTTPAR